MRMGATEQERPSSPADPRVVWRYRIGVLAGAWLGVPALVAVGAAGLTASLYCDTNGLFVIVAAAAAGPLGGWAWAAWRRARGWLLAAGVSGACLLGTLAGAAAWAAVALDRCFTF
jgi:hypothetical protein